MATHSLIFKFKTCVSRTTLMVQLDSAFPRTDRGVMICTFRVRDSKVAPCFKIPGCDVDSLFVLTDFFGVAAKLAIGYSEIEMRVGILGSQPNGFFVCDYRAVKPVHRRKGYPKRIVRGRPGGIVPKRLPKLYFGLLVTFEFRVSIA